MSGPCRQENVLRENVLVENVLRDREHYNTAERTTENMLREIIYGRENVAGEGSLQECRNMLSASLDDFWRKRHCYRCGSGRPIRCWILFSEGKTGTPAAGHIPNPGREKPVSVCAQCVLTQIPQKNSRSWPDSKEAVSSGRE